MKRKANSWGAIVVAIVKNEVPYIDSWVSYYLSLGFGHVVIYDNNSADGLDPLLSRYICGGVLTLIRWPVRAGQIDAYNHAHRLFGQRATWMAFFDIDEYLVMHHHFNIDSYLASYEADQILIPWRNFPHGGHLNAPGGTDLENYFWAHKLPKDGLVQVKHIVKSSAVLRVAAHCSAVGERRTMSADGDILAPSHAIRQPSYLRAQLNHYATRSLAENTARIFKGQVSQNTEKKAADFIPLTEKNLSLFEFDRSIMRHYKEFIDCKRQWARISDNPHRFGLMQTESVFSSCNHLHYFFAKSYANYVAGLASVSPAPAIELMSVSDSGVERPASQFWHNDDLTTICFKVGGASLLPRFLGSIHYSDFARRFGFKLLSEYHRLQVDTGWVCTEVASMECPAIIFDIWSESALSVRVDRNGGCVSRVSVPAGRNAGLIYVPAYSYSDEINLQFDGPAMVNEVLFGALP